MSFLPIQIVPVPGFGFSGGPEFKTNIVSLVSGREKRNADWSQCRHRYSAPYKNISHDAYLAVKQVFLLCRGRAHSFLFKDPADYQATGERFGTGDGTAKTFQLQKISSAAGMDYARTITRPAAGAVIKVNGTVTGASVSTSDGSVVFAAAPAAGAVLTWSGAFFVQVRFDMDYMPFSLDDKNRDTTFNNATIDLIEVLGEGDDA